MKNSKLDQFKKHELKSKEIDIVSRLHGGDQGDDGTWQHCKEETSGGSDSLYEKWPDEGGAVWQTYVF